MDYEFTYTTNSDIAEERRCHVELRMWTCHRVAQKVSRKLLSISSINIDYW